MSKTVKVEWIASERVLPNYGTKNTGDLFDVPDHVAKSLIYSGVAIKAKTLKTVIKSEEDS